MLRRIIAVALAVQLTACAHSGPTLAELDARRQQNAAASSVVYEGYSVEQLRSGAYEVLKLINPGDMKFDVRSDRLLATQSWWLVILFTGSSGERWYEVKFEPEGEAIRVSLGLEETSDRNLLVPTMRQASFRENISVSSEERLWLNSKLFFERLDYMLGRSEKWPTCPEFEKAYGATPVYLCGGLMGGIGILDRAPAARP